MNVRWRCVAVALRHNLACAALALPALGRDPQFKLNLVKAHARARMLGDLTIRDTVTYANNHGENLGKRADEARGVNV